MLHHPLELHTLRRGAVGISTIDGVHERRQVVFNVRLVRLVLRTGSAKGGAFGRVPTRPRQFVARFGVSHVPVGPLATRSIL